MLNRRDSWSRVPPEELRPMTLPDPWETTGMGFEETGDIPWHVSDGVAWIHADWPAYPMGDTWQAALINFGSFPERAVFVPIDYVDKCVLLHVQGFGAHSDKFDERGFHIAVWDENIKELSSRSFITLEGIEFVTHRKYEEFKRDTLRKKILDNIRETEGQTPPDDPLIHLGYMFEGKFQPLELPPLESYEDDDSEEGWYLSRAWLRHEPSARILLTDSGVRQLERFWASALKIPEQAEARITPLIANNMYDMAIRELGALLESQMRKVTSSSAYGVALVDKFMSYLVAVEQHDDWSLKVLRKELRTALKFVRNEFAHNVVDLCQPRANALIARMCHVLKLVEEVG
jgi:hypothetical protein